MSLPICQPTRREFLAYAGAAVATGATGTTAIAAAGTPLQFMVIGDWGREGAYHQRPVAAAMGQFRSSQFVVTAGDNFYKRGVASARDRQWDTSFNRIYTDVPQPWYAVLGNHDYGGSVEAQIERSLHDPRWRMPYYWYDLRLQAYGRPDVHLFCIDTVAWRGKEKSPYDRLGSPVREQSARDQREWLRDRLGGSDAPIKIVCGHHPIYSIRTGGSYYGMADLDALLFDYGATAYLNGHDHCMYHISAPDWRGQAAGRMHYLCSGAGSRMRAVLPSCIPSGLASETACVTKAQLGPRNPFWHAFFTKDEANSQLDLKGGFAVFDLDRDALGIRFIEPVADPVTGQPWRARYAGTIARRGA